ncbi:MAG: TonB-dependent receptor [Nitrospira sp.]|nr:TonB-dependent receptor [Nitrospira sp.]
MQWHPHERWLLRGGVRYEDVRLEASDFINFIQNTIQGGTVGYSATVFNAGTVVDLTKEINTFFNYSEGFSLPSLADSFAFQPSGSLESVKPKAIRVRNYEVGLRGTWSPFDRLLVAIPQHLSIRGRVQSPDGATPTGAGSHRRHRGGGGCAAKRSPANRRDPDLSKGESRPHE